MYKILITSVVSTVIFWVFEDAVHAGLVDQILFSTQADNEPMPSQFGIVNAADEDVVNVILNDPANENDNVVTLKVDGSSFMGLATGSIQTDIDGFHYNSNGTFYFNTFEDVVIDSVTYRHEDILLFDPSAAIGSRTTIAASVDPGVAIDALYVDASGLFYLSTSSTTSINGTIVRKEDVFTYDGTNVVSVVFDGSLFLETDSDIDGFHILPDGDFAMSTRHNESFGGGSFVMDQGDIFRVTYNSSNPSSSIVSTFLKEDQVKGVGNDMDIDAVSAIPEPSAFFLLGAMISLGAVWKLISVTNVRL